MRVKKVLSLKSSREQRRKSIFTTFDKCAQQLLVLVLEPVIEPFSDFNSFSVRSFRSAHSALSQLK